jgi:hypothetical protein
MAISQVEVCLWLDEMLAAKRFAACSNVAFE